MVYSMSEIHAHWHSVHGWDSVCPLDCGANEYLHEEEQAHYIKCGKCKGFHETAREVRACYGV